MLWFSHKSIKPKVGASQTRLNGLLRRRSRLRSEPSLKKSDRRKKKSLKWVRWPRKSDRGSKKIVGIVETTFPSLKLPSPVLMTTFSTYKRDKTTLNSTTLDMNSILSSLVCTRLKALLFWIPGIWAQVIYKVWLTSIRISSFPRTIRVQPIAAVLDKVKRNYRRLNYLLLTYTNQGKPKWLTLWATS